MLKLCSVGFILGLITNPCKVVVIRLRKWQSGTVKHRKAYKKKRRDKSLVLEKVKVEQFYDLKLSK